MLGVQVSPSILSSLTMPSKQSPSSRRSHEKKTPKVVSATKVVAPITRACQTIKPTVSYSDMLKRKVEAAPSMKNACDVLKQSAEDIQTAMDSGLSWGDIMTDSAPPVKKMPVVPATPVPATPVLAPVVKQEPAVASPVPATPVPASPMPATPVPATPVPTPAPVLTPIPNKISLNTRPSSVTQQAVDLLAHNDAIKDARLKRDRFASESSRVPLKRMIYDKALYRRFYARSFRKWLTMDEYASALLTTTLDYGKANEGYYTLVIDGRFEGFCLTSQLSSARICATAMLSRFDFPFVAVIGLVGSDGKAKVVDCVNATSERPDFMEPLVSSPCQQQSQQKQAFDLTPESQPQESQQQEFQHQESQQPPQESQQQEFHAYSYESTIAYIFHLIQTMQAQIQSLQAMVATLCGGIAFYETPLCPRRQSKSEQPSDEIKE